MKLYFASPLQMKKDRDWIAPIENSIRALDIPCFFPSDLGPTSEIAKQRKCSIEIVRKEIADIEIQQAVEADGVIACLPPYHSELPQGTAIEIGCAIANNKPVLLFYDENETAKESISLMVRFYKKCTIAAKSKNVDDIIAFWISNYF